MTSPGDVVLVLVTMLMERIQTILCVRMSTTKPVYSGVLETEAQMSYVRGREGRRGGQKERYVEGGREFQDYTMGSRTPLALTGSARLRYHP